MDSDSKRLATHAGSWYTHKSNELDTQLSKWLQESQAELKNIKLVKGIIGPHAGYTYSGPTAAWAYKYMDQSPKDPLRVFLLGPSHHKYFEGCALSDLKTYETPIGDIELDRDSKSSFFVSYVAIAKLQKEGEWIELEKEEEEEEHSLEMHLPYIRKAFQNRKIKLVPIMVGMIDNARQQEYGKLLAKYFDDENTVFVISSDFCHWGKRFKFQYYKKEDGEIHESIEKLDRRGMKLIESHDFKGFADYLKETSNTICGRRPIGVFLNVITNSKYSKQLLTRFVRYAQSEAVQDPSDSSVSYASSVTYLSE